MATCVASGWGFDDLHEFIQCPSITDLSLSLSFSRVIIHLAQDPEQFGWELVVTGSCYAVVHFPQLSLPSKHGFCMFSYCSPFFWTFRVIGLGFGNPALGASATSNLKGGNPELWIGVYTFVIRICVRTSVVLKTESSCDRKKRIIITTNQIIQE